MFIKVLQEKRRKHNYLQIAYAWHLSHIQQIGLLRVVLKQFTYQTESQKPLEYLLRLKMTKTRVKYERIEKSRSQ